MSRVVLCVASVVMSVPIKLCLHRDWNEKAIEIRRILLDSDSHAGYEALVEKIGQLFPALRTDKLTIAWLGTTSKTGRQCVSMVTAR